MADPNEYISVSRKNFLSNDNEGKMVEKSFLEIQGTFLMKIRDNTFIGIIRENAFEHIDNFLEVVRPLKIKGVSQDRFGLSVFLISLAGTASEWFKKDCIGSVTTWENLVEKFIQKFYQLFDDHEEIETNEDDDPDDIAKNFKIEDNLFDFETPLCKAFNEFNYLLKINTDLFTFDIQGIKTYEEYELNNNMTMDFKEPWSDNGVPYQLYDHICEPYRFKNGKKFAHCKWELIMEYLVKISKKARFLELKQRNMKITVLTSYTSYQSWKIWRICACTSQKTTKEQDQYAVKCKYMTRNTGKGRKDEENTDSYQTLQRNPYDSVTP
ncbi:hypothetical protein Tco_0731269 [Tanacetum coccineum]